MGNSEDTSPSFTCFPDLAGELRNMIWREALPHEPAPALVPFRPGCWAPEGDEPDLELRFDHEKLEPIRFDVALLLVNREARGIALAWMSERGFAMLPRESSRSVCARPFDPAFDALYIGPAHWDNLHCEAIDRSFEPDMLGRVYGTESEVHYIAMSESFVEEKMGKIPTLAFHFEHAISTCSFFSAHRGNTLPKGTRRRFVGASPPCKAVPSPGIAAASASSQARMLEDRGMRPHPAKDTFPVCLC